MHKHELGRHFVIIRLTWLIVLFLFIPLHRQIPKCYLGQGSGDWLMETQLELQLAVEEPGFCIMQLWLPRQKGTALQWQNAMEQCN